MAESRGASTSPGWRGAACLLLVAFGAPLLTAALVKGIERKSAQRVLGATSVTETACGGNACRNKLVTLSLGLMLYRDKYGHYPRKNGALFLVELYRSGIYSDPSMFICPSTADDNQDGRLLLIDPLPPGACSYLGRLNALGSPYAIPENEENNAVWRQRGTVVVAADKPGNHSDGCVNVGYLDGHHSNLKVALNPGLFRGLGER